MCSLNGSLKAFEHVNRAWTLCLTENDLIFNLPFYHLFTVSSITTTVLNTSCTKIKLSLSLSLDYVMKLGKALFFKKALKKCKFTAFPFSY